MDHTEGLRGHRQTLVLGQSIQSLKGCLYLVLSRQHLHEFLCDSENGQRIVCDGTLTEPPLHYLLCSQGKHRK